MPRLNIKTVALTTILLTIAFTTTAHLGRPAEIVNGAATSASFRSETDAQGNERVTDEAPSNIQVVLITLRSEGFEPTEMRLPSGEYLVIVRNRTGLASVNVQLQREAGERLGTATVGARQRDWKQRTRLTPGVYLLSETDHPDWTCRIVVA